MDLKRKDSETIELSMSIEELRYFRACAGDAFASLQAWDFPTRIGVSIERASDIAAELVALMEREGIDM